MSVELITPEILTAMRHHAVRLSEKIGWAVDSDELFSEAQFSSLKAAARFEPSRGNFKGFILARARGAMLDHLRRVDPVPRRQRKLLRSAEDKAPSALTKLERRALARRTILVHIDAQDEHFMDREQAESGVSELRQLNREAILPALRRLNETEQFVIWQTIVLESPRANVSAFLEISEVRIGQILRRGMEKLRRHYRSLGAKAA
jgi:RNA polymerase sigma factor for flagellar operon FliA